MIKANELRIGNYTMEGVIAGIRFSNTWYACVNDKWMEMENINPVSLTPIWLMRLGFEKSGDHQFNQYEIEEQYLLRENEINYECNIVTETYGGQARKYWRFKKAGDVVFLRQSIEYVHQLQNLYFALASQDLTKKQ